MLGSYRVADSAGVCEVRVHRVADTHPPVPVRLHPATEKAEVVVCRAGCIAAGARPSDMDRDRVLRARRRSGVLARLAGVALYTNP